MIEIDKHKVYESHGYRFINFIELSLDQKKMILEWRNHEKVRLMMLHKDPILLDDHLRFIDGLTNRTDCFYWMVVAPDETPIGVLDLLHIDRENDSAEFGNYMNPNEAGRGFDFLIECNYFIFSILRLGNNLLTVNAKNKEVLLFIQYLGGAFEDIEQVGDETYYVSKHANGDNILQNYENLSLADYARFVRKNKKNINVQLKKIK